MKYTIKQFINYRIVYEFQGYQSVLQQPHPSAHLQVPSLLVMQKNVGHGVTPDTTRAAASPAGTAFNMVSLSQELHAVERLSVPVATSPRRSTLPTVKQAQKDDKEERKVYRQYIPGLHRPGENFAKLPERRKPTSMNARRIPQHLLVHYLDGTKNAISSIHEYSQIHNILLEFKEVAAPEPVYYGLFAYQCVLDGKPYQPGLGRTKKAAKNESAAIAFSELMAVNGDTESNDEDEAVQPVVRDKVRMDPDTDREYLGNKDPVTRLYECCEHRQVAVNVKVHEIPPLGYQCVITIDGQQINKTYSKTKKDAKLTACEEAIKILSTMDTPSQTQVENMWHFDVMRYLTNATLDRLFVTDSWLHGPSSYASFIVKRNPEDQGEVVALGTGHHCLLGTNLRCDGRALLDCHAPVIARRALLKWFYKKQKQKLYIFNFSQNLF